MARTRFLLPLFFAAFTTLSLVAQDAGVPEAKAPREGTLLEALPSGALAFAETAGLAELIASIKGSASYQTLLASEQFKAIQATEKLQ